MHNMVVKLSQQLGTEEACHIKGSGNHRRAKLVASKSSNRIEIFCKSDVDIGQIRFKT